MNAHETALRKQLSAILAASRAAGTSDGDLIDEWVSGAFLARLEAAAECREKFSPHADECVRVRFHAGACMDLYGRHATAEEASTDLVSVSAEGRDD